MTAKIHRAETARSSYTLQEDESSDDSELDALFKKAGVKPKHGFGSALQKIMERKIQEALESSGSEPKAGSSKDGTGESVTPGPECCRKTASDVSPESLVSATTCAELHKLEFLRKTLETRIAAKRGSLVAPEQGLPGWGG